MMPRPRKTDIYGLEKKFNSAKKTMQNDPRVGKRNQKLISEFLDFTEFQGKSLQTKYKRLSTLCVMAREMGKDFDQLTEKDIEKYVTYLHGSDYSPKTIQVKKVSLKLLVRWLAKHKKIKRMQKVYGWMDEFVKTTLNAKNEEEKMNIDKENLLSEEEILDFARSVKGKDRAFIMALFESGARIGEFLPLRRKDIKFEDGGYALITLLGKTGKRETPIKNCVPDLTRWLNDLPEDPNQALWIVEANNGKGNTYDHRSMKRHIYSLGREWQKTKEKPWSEEKLRAKLHFHNWRHSRATDCARKGWSEYEMCVFFGWRVGSKVPGVYVKLSGRDLLRRMKLDNGDVEEKIEPSKLGTKKCPVCETKQSATNRLCLNCGNPLDVRGFQELQRKNEVTKVFAGFVAQKNPELFAEFKELWEKHEQKESL